MLAVSAELAGSAAYRAHQNRHVEIHVPAGGIAIYPEADRFTVSTDSDYQVWSLSGRREISSVPWPDDGPVELSPDGRLIAAHYCKKIVFDYCTGDEYGVKVLRTRDGAEVAERQLSTGGADLVRWSPDSSTLAAFLHNSNDLQLLDMPEARPTAPPGSTTISAPSSRRSPPTAKFWRRATTLRPSCGMSRTTGSCTRYRRVTT